MLKLALAADHGGFELKNKLLEYYKNQNLEIIDLGTNSIESCDYPVPAQNMCNAIVHKKADLGILICGTGIGISIAANRCHGIRAAILYDDETAHLAREHNNANVAVFGGRTMKYDDVIRRMDIFLKAQFEAGRHQRRIDGIEEVK